MKFNEVYEKIKYWSIYDFLEDIISQMDRLPQNTSKTYNLRKNNLLHALLWTKLTIEKYSVEELR